MIDYSLFDTLPDSVTERSRPCSTLTSFRIGGEADIVITPSTEKDFVRAIRLCRENSIYHCVVGRGSNLLFDDRGFRGALILTEKIISVSVNGNVITAGCGASLGALSRFALDNSLTGLEFASGIPGTVGGAVYMNAGAYGSEIKDFCRSVRWYDAERDIIGKSCGDENGFSYRHSAYTDNGKTVLSADFELNPGKKEEIIEKMNELAAKRREKQPLTQPSAGSAFKRPEGAYAAALIDGCGLKGCSVGGAQVSEKHAGFIVSNGSATCSDVLKLIEYVRNTVYKETGYLLEPEIKYISENP